MKTIIVKEGFDPIRGTPPSIRIYLAGPVSGYDFYKRKEYFAYKAARLRAMGYEVVDPLSSEEYPLTWEEALKQDIPKLVTCHAIYLLPGWEESRGAQLEHHIAVALGLQVLLDEVITGCTRAAKDST